MNNMPSISVNSMLSQTELSDNRIVRISKVKNPSKASDDVTLSGVSVFFESCEKSRL